VGSVTPLKPGELSRRILIEEEFVPALIPLGEDGEKLYLIRRCGELVRARHKYLYPLAGRATLRT
jgi:hypothetical protein